MTTAIDQIDRQIVDLLIEDGRMPASEIARRIGGISVRAVRYRVDRLIENNVIHVGAIVNQQQLGLSVIADVLLEIEPGVVLDVARELAKFDLVGYVACSTGETDISVQIYAHNNVELYRFVTEVIAKIPGVRKTTTSLVPIIVKDDNQWHIPAFLCSASGSTND